MKTILFAIFLVASLSSSGIAGNTLGKGNRLILATYWGDDKVALLDLEGEPGKEEIWVLDTLKAAGCSKPYDIRSNRRGDTAYVSCSGTNQIAIVDVVAQQVKAVIETGQSPRDLILFDDDKRLIVANSGNDTVSIIDTAERKKLYDFPISTQPYGVAVTRDGKTALVTGWASGDLHFVSLGEASADYLGKVDVGLLPYTVSLAGDPQVAYVAANGNHKVVAVDIDQQSVVNEIKVGRNPWSLAASPQGDSLLVTNNRSNNLSLLKTGAAPAAALPQPATISAGAEVMANGASVERAAKNASISANGESAVFTDLANNQIVLVDLDTGAIKKAIDVGKAPYGIEYLKSPE